MQKHMLSAMVGVMRVLFTLCERVAPDLAARWMMRIATNPRRIAVRSNPIMAQAERLHIPYQTGALAAYAWGSGPRVLLVHGWELNAASMTAFVEPLVQAGFRVIAIDTPGHGSTGGKRNNLFILRDSLRATIDQLGPLDAIVAHSLSGSAVLWSLTRPSALPVERVVTIAAPASLPHALQLLFDITNFGDRSYQALERIFAQHYGIALDIPFAAGLAQRDLPGLIIHDQDDNRISFANAELIAAEWPTARMLATKGLGHNRMLRSEIVVDHVVSFLSARQQPERAPSEVASTEAVLQS